MASSITFNIILIAVAGIAIFLLTRPVLLKNTVWQATLTPLSSIIGSGFLVMAPLLSSIVGVLSPVAVIGIVFLAYAIGHVIRFNIMHVEPRLRGEKPVSNIVREVEYLGNVALCVAYIVAVAFYLSLLSSFLLNYLGVSNLVLERSLTTVIIAGIALMGYFKGLSGLEKLESWSMTVQLSIVVALVLGLAVFGINFINSDETLHIDYQDRKVFTQMQMLAGALLIVQGFETTRFLGEKYSAEVRVKSMRYAQIIAAVIYIVSVILLLPVVQHIDLVHIELSNIVSATGIVAVVLPSMVIISALMSQFSAAVADTSGGGGLLNENSSQRISTNIAYICVSFSAVLLIWSVNLLNVINLASKAFAIYYFLQTLLALFYSFKDCADNESELETNIILYVGLLIVLGYVILFSIPAE